MAGTQKTVNITIASADLETLKDNAYLLCFAKKVVNAFDVVWQSYRDYLYSNTFQWTPVYQLFGSELFESQATVRVSTNSVNIGLGQQATLDKAGVLGAASPGGPTTAITMVNDYGPIHPGLIQLSTGIMGQQEATPIYVAQEQIIMGNDVLTPIEEVMVWFEQNIQTSTMFSDAKSNSVTIDMTDSDSQTRLYSGGTWSAPSASDLAVGVTPSTSDLALAGIPILTIILYATGAIIARDLASRIASKLTGVYNDITVEVTTGASNKVTVTYYQKQGLTSSEQSFLATLMTSTSTDTLMDFTVDSLAQSGVGFTRLEATT